MPRKFIEIGCKHETKGVTSPEGILPSVVATVFVFHSIRVENVFMEVPEFRSAMKVDLASDLLTSNPGVRLYQHRVTSDAVSIGVFKMFSMSIVAVDPDVVSPRFGAVAKIVQPGCKSASKEQVAADVAPIVFDLDGCGYKIDPLSVKEVGGRKYR